jgi:DNA-directed RNA polymerase specialized sigma24 family protein
MSTQPILRQAPYLRRYARALVGSQTEGDDFVRRTLEALLDGDLELPERVPVRLALFRAFHVTWRAALNGYSMDSGPPALRVDVRLQRMTPEHRTAVLLVLMEGFTLGEAAFILGVPEAEAERRFRYALASIESQLATDVLIIEDEPIVALDLERLVGDLGHRVLGVASTHTEAVDLVRERTPGLVLADVRLADGSSGVEAVADILKSYDAPVVFITAFPEKLLTGERPEPAFLVTKPFNADAVKALIGQALFFHDPAPRVAVV